MTSASAALPASEAMRGASLTVGASAIAPTMTRPPSSLALVVNQEGMSEATGAAGGGAPGAAGAGAGGLGAGVGTEGGVALGAARAPMATHTTSSPIAVRVYPAFCTTEARSAPAACLVACWYAASSVGPRPRPYPSPP